MFPFPLGHRPLHVNGLPAFNLNTLDPLTSSESSGTFTIGLQEQSIPTAYVEMNTPRGTTSATLEDVTGASVSIVLTKQQYVTIHCSFEIQTQSGASATTIGIALLYDSTTETEYQRYLSGSNDQGLGSIIARTALLDAGTHTVKLQFRRVSGLATPGINKLDLLVSGTVLQ